MANILILSCRGGGGHVSAARAVEQYLHDHQTISVDFIGQILAPNDPLYFISGGRLTGQDLYNFLLKKNCKQLANILYQFGWVLLRFQKKAIARALDELIEQVKPNLIVSVIPIVNGVLADVAQRRNIPALIIPTDLDLRSFTAGVDRLCHSNSWLGIGFDTLAIRKLIQPESFSSDRIVSVGFPIRSDFFPKKSKAAARSLFKISEDIPVIMLIMGAAGSACLEVYFKELLKIPFRCHLLVCLGRSNHLAKKLVTFPIPAHITYQLFDSSCDIAHVMAATDICISKPGSVTFAETLYNRTPVFLDATGSALIWEKFNISFVAEQKCGRVIKKIEDLLPYIQNFFIDQQARCQMQDRLNSINCLEPEKLLAYQVEKILNHSGMNLKS